jgi:hypothetical protein
VVQKLDGRRHSHLVEHGLDTQESEAMNCNLEHNTELKENFQLPSCCMIGIASWNAGEAKLEYYLPLLRPGFHSSSFSFSS